MRRSIATFAACLLCVAAHAGSTHVVICGSGGEEAYSKQFLDWGTRLRTVLGSYDNDGSARVFLMTETPSGDARTATLEGIRALFQELAESTPPEHDVYVYLIGHGSFRAGVSKFNVPGPDLTAEDLDSLLDALSARRCIVVNGSSASAGFINVLSGDRRVICTATKSAEERNATRFMGFFVEALEEGLADADRDDRISLLEACSQAAVLTAASFENDGLIPSEHAILDDNGDGLGVRLPLESEPESQDGSLAAACLLKDYQFPPDAPQDLITAYQGALESLDALKKQKASLPESDYYARLKSILLQAARAHRALRTAQ